MWARGDMKNQIPQKLGLTPKIGLDPTKARDVETRGLLLPWSFGVLKRVESVLSGRNGTPIGAYPESAQGG